MDVFNVLAKVMKW